MEAGGGPTAGYGWPPHGQLGGENHQLVRESRFGARVPAADGSAVHTAPKQHPSAGVELLALTHLSSRYFGSAIEKEARALFERTVVPRDFDAIEIPYRERGEPSLVRWKGTKSES